MKNIKDMTLLELADYCGLHSKYELNPDVSHRLRELHNLTRWVPVSERLPTEKDARDGVVDILMGTNKRRGINQPIYKFNEYNIRLYEITHWMTPPEN
jgi:hypothetical protein